MKRSLFLALLVLVTAAAPGQSSKNPARPLILAFGDSLTAGYGLGPGLGFAPQLQATLRRRGVAATVVDGGVSGDTATGGAARIGWTLDGMERAPDLVIVELGANDMLRAIDPSVTRAALDKILAELRRRKIRGLLTGMRAAPNLDPAYRTRFEAIYPALARAYAVPRDPFFLEGVAGNRALVQTDGLHPTFDGIKIIAVRIAPAVEAALVR